MPKKAQKRPQRSDDDIRRIMLQYFYDRNKHAKSYMGKAGAAVNISTLRADLKASRGLNASEVVSNLTYLLSQGWVEEKRVEKTVRTPGGTVPSVTSYYIITAAGIDKMGGPSEFMRDRFQGIKIEATGQNIITLGDGNQVNVQFRDVGEALAALREAIKESRTLEEAAKVDLVVDVDSIQDQLAKREPNKTVLQTLWTGIERVATAHDFVEAAVRVAPLIAALLR